MNKCLILNSLKIVSMEKKWNPVLEIIALGTMVAFASFIIVAFLTVMTTISQARIYC